MGRMKPVALVTGAGQGLGLHLAGWLAHRGYAVAIHFRSTSNAAFALHNDLARQGLESMAVQADLSREAEAAAAVAEIEAKWGRLDVLVNNASSFAPRKLDALTEAEWNAGLDSTVTAAFFTTRHSLPLLRKSGQGRIINIGDSRCADPGFAEPAFSYYVGKAGIWMLTQTLAVLEAPHGITANCVSPGMFERTVAPTTETRMPMGRFATYEDMEGALAYLLSDEAAYVTGSNLLVTGGWNIAPRFASVHDAIQSKLSAASSQPSVSGDRPAGS
jgi:3-oxoacyl-[acyl-carrier protein] reductase